MNLSTVVNLVWMDRNNPSVACSAGTKQPIWLRYTIIAICLRYTDFPLLLGPVRIRIGFESLSIYGIISAEKKHGNDLE